MCEVGRLHSANMVLQALLTLACLPSDTANAATGGTAKAEWWGSTRLGACPE